MVDSNDSKSVKTAIKVGEHAYSHILSTDQFIKRFGRNLFIGIVVSASSLFVGMLGYHHYEGMPWVDAYVNAAMILSGMGPVVELKTEAGKIFAGTYALFSGIIFLVVMAIIFAPVIHRFFQKFHLDDVKFK